MSATQAIEIGSRRRSGADDRQPKLRGTLHQLFESRAARSPATVAVELNGAFLSYGELDRRAARLARHLRSLGVGPEVRVGLLSERGPELAMGMLGILKAGGVLVPLDPNHPDDRLRFMLRDADARGLVTFGGRIVPSAASVDWTVRLDAEAALPEPDPPSTMVPASSQNLAYVIYTSGSTGRPKGVAVSHGAVCQHGPTVAERYRLAPEDRVLQTASIGFDLVIEELFPSWARGATVVQSDSGLASGVAEFLRFAERQRLSVVNLPTPFWHRWAAELEEGFSGLPPTLRLVIVGTEQALADRLEIWRRRVGKTGRWLNAYGPSEATITATIYEPAAGEKLPSRVPIGRTIAGAQAAVVNHQLLPVAKDDSGELCLGGSTLARGYLGRPALTANRFVPDPFTSEAGGRLYLTGDRAEILRDGNLVFLGRLDHQVKIRGFRIELEEVEAALNALPTVVESGVVTGEDPLEGQRLIAWVVATDVARPPAPGDLRAALSATLPGYMVPALFLFRDLLPRTPSGKLDRPILERTVNRAAPMTERPRDGDFVPPRTVTEALLAAIWSEVLGFASIGAHDDFFALGGHSLMAGRIVARASATFDCQLLPSVLFTHPELAEMARAIEQARGTAEATRSPLVPSSRAGHLPLSFAQQRLWLFESAHPGLAVYNIAETVDLSGQLDVAVLTRALAEIVRRHEALRTRVAGDPETPHQAIQNQAIQNQHSPILGVVDLSALPPDSRRQQAAVLGEVEARLPLDPAAGRLLRVTLLRLAPAEHQLLLTVHHIAADGWSMEVLYRELAALYRSFSAGQPSALPELEVQYADYAVWQHEWLEGAVLAADLAYWQKRLLGLPPMLELPTDRSRPTAPSFRGARQPVSLPRALQLALGEFSRRQSATLFMTLLAAFQALLARVAGQTDLAVGVPSANRGRPELEGLIGFFVNLLVMRATLPTDPALRDLLQQTRELCLEAYDHQGLPFERLVEALPAARDPSRHPVFQVVFQLIDAGAPVIEIPGLDVTDAVRSSGTAKFDLELTLIDSGQELSGYLEYATDLFDETTVRRWWAGFHEFLEQIVDHPERRLSRLHLLSRSGRHQLHTEWNDTGLPTIDESVVHPPFVHSPFVHHQFSQRTRRAPMAVAVAHGSESKTYEELERDSDRLAICLRQLGVGPEVVVGVLLERRPRLVVTCLAVLKAGGAYLSLDPDYPGERLEFMIRDSGAQVIVGDSHGLAGLNRSRVTAQWLDLDRGWPKSESDATLNPMSTGLSRSNLAYVIYTSGSTGWPKGVAISHAGLANLVRWHRRSYRPQAGDRVSHLAGLSFDASVWEMWPPLVGGASLHLVDEALRLDPARLLRWFADEGITQSFAPTPMAEALLETPSPERLALRILNTGGDRLHRRPPRTAGFRLINHYGPAENSVVSTAAKVPPTGGLEPPPIGRPIDDVGARVLDRHFETVPLGTPGELTVGGRSLARGYLGSPGLTAERFVADPCAPAPGRRLYRTGDRVRQTIAGEIDFLGRVDHQVELRGIRIEPGEIESILGRHPLVAQAAVVVAEVRQDGVDPRLVAFVVATGDVMPGQVELVQHLAQVLPDSMIPSSFPRLEELPLTANGKVDRAELMRRARAGEVPLAIEDFEAPRTPAEEMLAGIWSEILDFASSRPVSRNDNFFNLGGHSLLATRMTSRVREVFDLELPLHHVFKAPTLAELAAILAGRMEAERPVAERAIERATRDRPLPLSLTQERLWFLDRLLPGQALYNIPMALDLRGSFDLAALAAAFDELIRRHEVLRTHFEEVAGSPRQIVEPASARALPVVDLGALGESFRQDQVCRVTNRWSKLPFDLQTGPLMRPLILRCNPQQHRLVLNLHHIICDGWSIEILLQELPSLYTAARQRRHSSLPALPIQYGDFAIWQRHRVGRELMESQLDEWRQYLAGCPELLELPTDRLRPLKPSLKGSVVSGHISRELRAELQALAQEHGATLFMVLLAGFKTLLFRHSGSSDLLVGCPVAGRGRSEVEPLVGFFANTLVMRTAVAAEQSFGELLGRVRETVLWTDARQDVPFEKLVEELRPERNLSHSPLFQVAVAFHTSTARSPWPDLETASEWIDTGSSKFDLTLGIMDSSAGCGVSIEYSSELFDRTTVVRFLDGYLRLVTACLSQARAPIGGLNLLSAAERHQLVAEWNDTESPEGGRSTIHRLFSQQARRYPEAVALVCGVRCLSYGALERASDRLARRLRRQGVGPEILVGVSIERCPELMVALLGILKAGGAYLPLDPIYPPERVRFVLEDAAVSLVVVLDRRPATTLPTGMRTVSLDAGSERDPTTTVIEASEEVSTPSLAPRNLAYVMYTSGSTGLPKGTRVHHQGVVRLVQDPRYVLLGREQVLSHLAPIAFDASTFEIWGALLNGGRLAIMPAGTPSLHELGQAIEHHRVTTLWLTSALFQQMVESELTSLRGVAAIFTGGDVVPVPHVRRTLDELPELCVNNVFGPTENTTYTTYNPVRDLRQVGATVSIGRPIDDSRIYVFDRRLELASLGVPGELYCAGAGLARDYLERPALTAERFVPHPFGDRPGIRLYRIGDQARLLADGRLDFLGRLDHQVKIRGFRVEPGEIEAVLLAHPQVQAAAVVVRTIPGGDKRLAAYVVPQAVTDEPIDAWIAELSRHVSESLPTYMVPSSLEILEALPLNANGKVDRKVLAQRTPRVAGGAEVTPDSVPQSTTEELLVGIWDEILGAELPEGRRIGRQDNFFDLGGHSLLATRMSSRIREVFALDLPLQHVFATPTIAELGVVLEELVAAGQRPAEQAIERTSRSEPRPLSFAQERLWFLDHLIPGHALYNVPLALDLTGPASVSAIAAALDELRRRHEVLRTRFVEVGGRPCEVVDPPMVTALSVVDLSALTRGRRDLQTHREMRRWAKLPFDLAAGPVLRSLLLRRGPEEHRLILSLHHIACDGWSFEVLLRELPALYTAAREGMTSPLAELPVQYADYAVWQRRRHQSGLLEPQLDDWRRRLAGSPELLGLPTDRPRPANRGLGGAVVLGRVSSALRERLLALAQDQGATFFMVTLAAFKALLFRLGSGGDLAVGCPISGRSRREIEPLIGFFVNTLVMRTSVSADDGFDKLLRQVREKLLWADARQDVPFERLVEELRPERSLNHSPLFQVAMAFQTSAASLPSWVDLEAESDWVDTDTAKFDLTLGMMDSPEGCDASIEYSTELFDRTTASRWLGYYLRLLEALADAPRGTIGRLSLLSSAERHELLSEWNDTELHEADSGLLHQWVSRQARRMPDALAVQDSCEGVSYGELDRDSDRLAVHLRQLGVGPEVVVAVLLERRPQLVVTFLAILKAGGAYLSLDSDYPDERLEFMIRDSGARLVVGESQQLSDLKRSEITARWLELEVEWSAIESGGASAPVPTVELSTSNLAYIVYTSGSTGWPKGVAVSHAGLANLVRWHRRSYDPRAGDKASQMAGLSFDASVWEMWPPLAGGASLHLVDETLRLDPARLLRWFADEGITQSFVPTPVAEALLEAPVPEHLALRILNTGGDRLHLRPPETAGYRLINHYGPAESSVVSTSIRVLPAGGAQPPPIGRPIDGVCSLVVDRRLKPVPLGVHGELTIGGRSLARGYLGRPDLTSEQFVPDPFAQIPGQRLYRTGDRVRQPASGEIDFLGRVDHQVELRGVRIEPGEIESVLGRHSSVAQAAVVVTEPSSGAGNRRLVAFVVASEGANPGERELVDHLARVLPEPMIPSQFSVLDEMPLTANDKVDRAELERRAQAEIAAVQESEPVAPRTPTEELLAGIWIEVLEAVAPDLPAVGSQDNFFELGGHSLLATQVIARVSEAFEMDLTVRELFEHPTVAELAVVIDEAGRADRLPPLVGGPAEEEPPLSFTQERFWFLDQMTEGTNTYSVPFAVLLEGHLHVAALERFFVELLARHEVLRATFPSRDGRPSQRISTLMRQPLPVVDLEGMRADPQERELARLVSQAARRPFDLARGPLMRCSLVRLSRRRHALLVNFHHIVADSWSLRILIEEAQAVYRAFVDGRRSPLPPLPIQYRDFARWQRSWLGGEALAAELAHWRGQLGDRPPTLDLPRHPASGQGPIPSAESFRLPPEATEALKGFSQRHDATLFVTLLAAYGAVLARFSDQDRVVVGTVVANRSRVETEGLIGCFLNTLALPIDLAGDPTFEQLAVGVRRSTFDAYAHQDLPFEKLVEAYNPDRGSIQPLFQAFFTLDSVAAGASSIRLPGLELSPLGLVGAGRLGAKFDLAMEITDSATGLAVSLGYNAAMYPGELAKAVAEAYQATLLRLADSGVVRISELPGPSADDRRAMVQRYAADASGSEPTTGEPEKNAEQRLANERSQLEKRLSKLPPALRAKFAKRLQGRKTKMRQSSEIPRRKVAGPAPLSFAQERLWFIDRLEPGSPAYNIPFVARFRGPVAVASLARALNAILERHEALRTVFELTDDGPVQVVQPLGNRILPVVDLRQLADGATEATARIRDESRRPFDLKRGPLVRTCLLALRDEHVLILNVHHIVFDGWSTGILIRELQQLYEADCQGRRSPLAELPIQYSDFAQWQRQWLSGERLEEQLTWWRQRLHGMPQQLELPTDRPRPAVLTMAGGVDSFALPDTFREGVRQLAKGSGATPFMILLAGCKSLLHRLTGATDLAVGTPIANRNRDSVESLIGFFVNTLVLRTDLSSDLSFGTLVERVRETTVQAYDHQDLPFEKLVEDLQPERNLSQTPLFQAAFVFEEEAQGGGVDRGSGGGLAIDTAAGAPIAKFDLTLAFTERAAALAGGIEYRSRLFDATTVRRWGAYLRRLLSSALADSTQRLSELPLLAAAEQQQLLSEWNDSKTRGPGDRLLPALIARRARRSPDAVAVEHGGCYLTYGELDRRSRCLAVELHRLGVARGAVVALCAEPGEDLIVGLFGVLAAGGAFLPLEPTLPAARLSHMLDDARVSVVVTDVASAAALPPSSMPMLEVRAASRPTDADVESGLEPCRELRAEDPAYLIYTSGSTGAPKAVVVEHGSLMSTLEASRRAFDWSTSDRTPCIAPFSFDIFYFDVLSPLLAGGTTILFPLRPTLDLTKVVDALERATCFEAVPAVMRQVVDVARARGVDRFAGMRSLFIGGERVPPRLLADLRQVFPTAQVWIGYGPTEATIICSYYRVPATEQLPQPLLGRPLADVELRVVDRQGRPVPIGVIGEIHIGGPCVTRGYWNREALTAEKYPTVDRRRYFRSGDLGRFRADGNLEFLGRVDHQVKVHGKRVELGEIEAALVKQPEVSQAVVLVQRDPQTHSERLVAYVVGGRAEALRPEFLENALGEKLPDYMVPRSWGILEALPLTPNGKVDRVALDRLAPEELTSEVYEGPRDRLEIELCRLWGDLLGRERVGIREDFFAAGGYSLLVSRLQLRVENLCGWRPSVASLFQAPTIEQQATLLRRSLSAGPDASEELAAAVASLVAIRSSGSRPPLFCVHSGSGQVIGYHALARHLGPEQPFFAFQSPGLEDGRSGPETIEAMAEAYLDELLAQWPEGPCHLAGWSMGGLVALEMARSLLEQGREVGLLALLDTRAPSDSDAQPDDLRLLASFALHLGIPAERLPSLSEIEERGDSWQPLSALWQLASELGALPPDLGEAGLEHLFQVFRRNAMAVSSYRPRGYSQRVFLLTAEEETSDSSQDPALGWSELIEDLRIQTVPGHHFTMIGEPHAEHLASTLSELIEKGSGTVETGAGSVLSISS